MGNPGQQHVVPLAFLEAMRPDLLRRLLAEFAAALAQLGVPLEDGLPSRQWLARLYEVLTFENPFVPSSLQAALLNVLDLSSGAGTQSLHHQAHRLGVDLRAESPPASHQDFALWTQLAHPKVFLAAHSRFRICTGVWLAEYSGDRNPESRRESSCAESLEQRRALLLEQPARRILGVAVDSLERELVFGFSVDGTHGAVPSAAPDFSETIVYDKETGGLSLSVIDPDHLELYRVATGLLIGGAADYFRDQPLYSSLPLKELGSSSLYARDVLGIDRVALHSVTYTDENRVTRTDTAPPDGELDDRFDLGLRSGVLKQAFSAREN